MTKPIPQRVALTDLEPNLRRALALLLRVALGVQIVAEADILAGLLTHEHEQADLLLVGWAGIASKAPQVLAELRVLQPELRILVLSTRPEHAAAVLTAGADAFLSTVDPPAQVLATVRALLGLQEPPSLD